MSSGVLLSDPSSDDMVLRGAGLNAPLTRREREPPEPPTVGDGE